MAAAISGVKPRGDDGSSGNGNDADSLPVFDPSQINQLKEDYGDDLMQTLIAEFHNTAGDSSKTIATALEDGDRTLLHREAHSLKSSARTLGLAALSELCRLIEQACLDGDIEKAETLSGELPGHVDQALKALSDMG